METLRGSDKEKIIEMIKEFKLKFALRPAWEKGTPKRVNNLTKFTNEEKRLGKANMPGHVRAAMNWNNLKRMHSDNYSMQIMDGMKTIVCKLRDNPMGFLQVGLGGAAGGALAAAEVQPPFLIDSSSTAAMRCSICATRASTPWLFTMVANSERRTATSLIDPLR